jgi:hypothetical protein
MKNFVTKLGVFSIFIFLLYCVKNVQSENRGVFEIQKKVINEDKLNIKDGKSAIRYLSDKCNTNYNKPFYLKSEGQLKYFDCSTTPLSDEDVKYLVFSPELMGLHVTGKEITDRGLEYFKDFHNIESITFYNTSVTGGSFIYFKNFIKLTIIDLKGSPVIDEGFKYISEINFQKPINQADFSSTKITDDGLKYLGKLKFNGELRLKNTKITDKGLKHLVNQTELSELYLNNTKVTKEGIKWLKSQLPNLDVYTKDKDI